MKRTELNLSDYDTDKIINNYLDYYDDIFEEYIDDNICLLELGIRNGGSLRLWSDYFPSSKIVGIDLNIPDSNEIDTRDNIHMFKGNQSDINFLTKVAENTAPKGFEIIIDDASHIGKLTKISFWHLFENHLKPGGIYVIEDWGTGYWDDWPDGRCLDLDNYFQSNFQKDHVASKFIRNFRKIFLKKTPNFMSQMIPKLPAMPCHSHGMVGFVKQLIDEQAAPDVTKKSKSGNPKRKSKFKKIVIAPSIVFIFKRDN